MCSARFFLAAPCLNFALLMQFCHGLVVEMDNNMRSSAYLHSYACFILVRFWKDILKFIPKYMIGTAEMLMLFFFVLHLHFAIFGLQIQIALHGRSLASNSGDPTMRENLSDVGKLGLRLLEDLTALAAGGSVCANNF